MITQTQFTESEIDQKIDNLPSIAFDDNEEFQRVIMSQDFTDIFNYVMQTREIPDKIKSLPEIDQRISLYLNLTTYRVTVLPLYAVLCGSSYTL